MQHEKEREERLRFSILADASPELLEKAGIGAESIDDTRQRANAALDKQANKGGEIEDADPSPDLGNGGICSPLGLSLADDEKEHSFKKRRKEHSTNDGIPMEIDEESKVAKKLLQKERDRKNKEDEFNTTIEMAWEAHLELHQAVAKRRCCQSP